MIQVRSEKVMIFEPMLASIPWVNSGRLDPVKIEESLDKASSA